MENEKKRGVVFAVIIAIALLLSVARLVLEDLTDINHPDCTIEYGRGECINNYLSVPFYNPNRKDITSIKIVIPFGVETNITLPADFSVTEPLKSGKTGVLKLIPCEGDVDIRGFSIEWCCSGECYKSKMNKVSDKIGIEF